MPDQKPIPESSEGSSPRNNAKKTRGRPFPPGNPGRPKGSRHKTTVAIEAMLEGAHVALTEKLIEKALAGDGAASKLCFDRLAPVRRDAPVSFELPEVQGASDLLAASTA